MHELLVVSAHWMCDGVMKYLTTWKHAPSKSWVEEENFVRGFSLCDYWRSKCENQKRKCRDTHLPTGKSDEQDCTMDDGETTEDAIEFVTEHRDEDGITQYLTKWQGFPNLSWNDEGNFDEGGDITLANYWREKYEKQVSEQDQKHGKRGERGEGKRDRGEETRDARDKVGKREREKNIRKRCSRYFVN